MPAIPLLLLPSVVTPQAGIVVAAGGDELDERQVRHRMRVDHEAGELDEVPELRFVREAVVA